MQDSNPTLSEAPPAYPAAPVRRRRSAGGTLLAMLLAFVLGAALVAYLAWRGDLARVLPRHDQSGQSSATDGAGAASTGASRSPNNGQGRSTPAPAQVSSLEMRLAMLEDRFSRLDFEARAASGNAGRAEALLIAAAARRAIERGDALGFIGDQLNLRFGDAQPQAVQTIAAFARAPVTIDELSSRLEALTPDLTDTSRTQNLWSRTRQELVDLFTVHSDSPTLLQPEARIDRARTMLTAQRIDNAIDEVERLPGAEAAQRWIADARRFEEAQRALALIETTALLEPRKLKDGAGQQVAQPSPLAASPVATAATTPATAAPEPGATPAR